MSLVNAQVGEEAPVTFEFLSAEWFKALEDVAGSELEADDPVVNLVISDSPYGEVKAHIGGTHFLAGHHPAPDATATVPYKLARQIFVEGELAVEGNTAAINGAILGELQVEGDYSAWAMTTSSQNLMLVLMRLPMKSITTPHLQRFMTKKVAATAEVNAEVDRLGLHRHVRELDDQGYTLLTPDETGVTTAMMDRALDYILNEVTETTGVRPDVETGNTHQDVFYPVLWYQVLKDKVFQELTANESAVALAGYLFQSQDFHLSSDDVLMKGPTKFPPQYGKQQLGLHFDTVTYGFWGDEPLPEDVVSVNVLWLITDFESEADGVTVYVPGTHKYRRGPKIGKEGAEHAESILAPRGSFLIWPGTTWHGALPRTKPGLRVAMTIQYCAEHVGPRNPYQYDVTEEVLRQNPSRFARLMGLLDLSGWREEGVYARLHERALVGAQRYAEKPLTCSIPLTEAILTRKMKAKASGAVADGAREAPALV